MGAANLDAYEKTDLTRNVSAFHKVSYLLAHGTSDGNFLLRSYSSFRINFVNSK